MLPQVEILTRWPSGPLVLTGSATITTTTITHRWLLYTFIVGNLTFGGAWARAAFGRNQLEFLLATLTTSWKAAPLNVISANFQHTKAQWVGTELETPTQKRSVRRVGTTGEASRTKRGPGVEIPMRRVGESLDEVSRCTSGWWAFTKCAQLPP